MAIKSNVSAVKAQRGSGRTGLRQIEADSQKPFDAGDLDLQPRYARVAQSLIEEIVAGKYPVGRLIATESDLCARFGVSRNTARTALSVLSDMGMVSRHAGIGTVVRSLTSTPRFVQDAEALSALFPDIETTEQQTLSECDVVADASLSKLLECRRGERWRQTESLRNIRKRKLPVAYSHIYLPETLAHLSKHLDRLRKPAYTIIDLKSKFRVAKLIQETNACPVPMQAARHLAVEVNSPGLQVLRRYFSQDDETLMVATTVYPAGRYSFSFAINLPRV
jgi:DNA-binding GntR family transcriptional regulator